MLPLLLLVAGWRYLKYHREERVVGRGLGTIILLGTLPGLLQLTLGKVGWRGEEIAAGGGFGTVLSDWLSGALGGAGALVVLIGGVVLGVALVVQSTLGEILAGWRRTASERASTLSLWWARRREREHKEAERKRVATKHLKRAEERRREAPVVESMARVKEKASPARAEGPMRVVAKTGEAGFSVRKVAGSPEVVEAPPPEPAKSAPATPTAPPRKRRSPAKPKRPPASKPAPAASGQTALFSEAGSPDELPPLNLLKIDAVKPSIEPDELVRLGEVIRNRCAEFGVEGTIEGISPGPVITVFEFQPAPGVKVSQIVNLADDLALSLRAEAIRIDRMPGRSTLGIEVPNDERAIIHLGYLLDQPGFGKSRSPLTVALGTTIQGESYFSDLKTMPHLLVAGATGAGKSVGLQSMITSILYKATRDEVQFIFIDPKRIELGVYADIPHLKTEVVVEPKKAANALRWAVAEMERRYKLLAEVHVRSIDFYNEAIGDPAVQERLALSEGEEESAFRADDLKPLPHYVIVIDELADLMMVSSSEVEASIARIAQMARAVGIHLIIATPAPVGRRADRNDQGELPDPHCVCDRHPGTTRAPSSTRSARSGCSVQGATCCFMPPGTSPRDPSARRLHQRAGDGCPDPLAEEEPRAAGARRVGARGAQGGALRRRRWRSRRRPLRRGPLAWWWPRDRRRRASCRRRLRVGFSRASRLIDLMEQDGLLGPPQGSKPREVLVKPDFFSEIDETPGRCLTATPAADGEAAVDPASRRVVFFGSPDFAGSDARCARRRRAQAGARRLAAGSAGRGAGTSSASPAVAEWGASPTGSSWRSRSACARRSSSPRCGTSGRGSRWSWRSARSSRNRCSTFRASGASTCTGRSCRPTAARRPIQAAIANGETRTGVTTMLMERGLDSGPILLTAELDIGPDETAPELSDRLAERGAALIVETLDRLDRGDLEPMRQDDELATYAPRLTKEDARVDWTLPARTLRDRRRAHTPWPGAVAELRDEPIKLSDLEVANPQSDAHDAEPGTILGLLDRRLLVACGRGDGGRHRDACKRAGRRALAAVDFYNGERLAVGERFS